MADAAFEVRWGQSRGFTNALLEAVDEGLVAEGDLLRELLSWISESEVEEFCTGSLMLRDEDNLPVIRREEEVV